MPEEYRAVCQDCEFKETGRIDDVLSKGQRHRKETDHDVDAGRVDYVE